MFEAHLLTSFFYMSFMRLFFFFMLLPSALFGQEASQYVRFDKEELLGLFDPAMHPDFVVIEPAYTSKKSISLRKEVYQAFVAMHQAAKKDGINLVILSATRNFDYQKSIWERKWKDPANSKLNPQDRAKVILKYSSMPGSSRHHWGTDIDMNSLSPSYFSSGKGAKEYEWLRKNAGSFGFVQTYTSKSSGRTGYEEEQWHWSYIPLAGSMLEAYNNVITYADFKGFLGAETAAEMRMIEDYVNGVSSEAKK